MTLSQWIDYGATFIVVALAVYRLAILLTVESGPFDLLDKFRRLMPRGGVMQKLFACPFCMSIWMGFAGACVLPYYSPVWFVVSALALSATATILVKRFG